MKVKVSETSGTVLDWLVSKAIGEYHPTAVPTYSTDWSQGGPIIDKALISTCPIFIKGKFHYWEAFGHDLKYADNGPYIEGSDHRMYGPTRLIAGLRCFVSSKLGDEVEVPDQLGKT